MEPDVTPVTAPEIDAALAQIDATFDANALKLYGGLGWTPLRKDGIETFTSPGGEAYVRARPDEDADVIVSFPNTRGLQPLRLVKSSESATVKRAERKARRAQRELRKRGYDV